MHGHTRTRKRTDDGLRSNGRAPSESHAFPLLPLLGAVLPRPRVGDWDMARAMINSDLAFAWRTMRHALAQFADGRADLVAMFGAVLVAFASESNGILFALVILAMATDVFVGALNAYRLGYIDPIRRIRHFQPSRLRGGALAKLLLLAGVGIAMLVDAFIISSARTLAEVIGDFTRGRLDAILTLTLVTKFSLSALFLSECMSATSIIEQGNPNHLSVRILRRILGRIGLHLERRVDVVFPPSKGDNDAA